MRKTTFVTALFALTLLLAPLAGNAQGQKRGANSNAQQRAHVERGHRDMSGDRLRDRDRIHTTDNAKQAEQQMYGYELMSEEERNQYRERIRNAKNRQEAEQIEAQHRREMQIRAEQQGVAIGEPKMAQKGKDN